MVLDSITPIFTKRKSCNYNVNTVLSNRLADTFNKIKGRLDQELAQSGKITTNEYIKFRIDKKVGLLPSMKIFNDVIESRGLDIYFIIDCSYSMNLAENKLRDITSSILTALEKCAFINFNIICYSGNFSNDLYIQELTNSKESCYITADYYNRGTPTHLVLRYVNNILKKSQDKKMVILFTDGLPEDRDNYQSIQEQIKKQLIIMKNNKIKFFTIFWKNHEYNKHVKQDGLNGDELTEDITKKMRSMFKNTMYETDDFDQVEKTMTKILIKTVERMNQNE